MAINPNNGVLDIINGTLKVSSIDIKQAAGFTTTLNTVARNDVLLFDDQKASTVFTPTSEGGYMSSTGVTRDTTEGAGYIDLNDGWVYWPIQLPNSWHTEFDMHVTTTGGVLTFSLFNTSEPNHTDYTNNDGGYKIVFDNTTNKLILYYEGSPHKLGDVNIRSPDWQHVNINYFQGAISVSLAGKVVLTHEFTQNYQEFNSRYVGFSATTGASHKIRHLRVHNSDKWLYTKTSNASDITYVSGNVGIGTLTPTELLDVHGNVHIAKDLTVNGNLTVSGTTTFIDTQNLAIEDPIIEVARGNASDTIDAGLVITRATSNVAVAYRGDEEELALGYTQSGASDTDVTPITDGGLDVRVYGNLFANNLTTTANVEATYLKGDGSEITQVTLDQVVDYGNVTSNTIQLTNADVGLKATGNVQANYFVGNGSKLTGLVTDLQSVTDNGNTTSNTVQFTNATTALIADSNVGIGTSTPSANLHVMGYQYVNGPPTLANAFDHSDAPLTLTHDTATSSTAINDPKPLLHLTRSGTNNESYGARVSFNLSRYENSGTASRSRLDVALADGTYAETNVMSIRADGKVGVGTTTPGYTLDVRGTSNVGALTTTSVSGDGSGLTNLNASNISSGTINKDRLPTTLNNTTIGSLAVGTNDVTLTGKQNYHGLKIIKAFDHPDEPATLLLAGDGDTGDDIAFEIRGNGTGSDVDTTTTRDSDDTTFGILHTGHTYIGYPNLNPGETGGNAQNGDPMLNVSGDIYATGNVGIGTASPGYALDVHGTANVGTLTATSVSGPLSGNATTATKLATARAINGVDFDGSGNITVNGLNYDVNDAWLRENGDNANFMQYGNSRQMVFRTDGTTQYATDVGAYPFAWMYGGDAASNRRMLLNTAGQLWCSDYGWLHDKFMARTQVFTDNVANTNFTGQKIDHNCSGSDTLTADRTHRALLIDMDSSATGGDTSDEHRMYGIFTDVRHSGDSDIVSGMYSYARSDHTSGTTTNLRAGEFTAIASGTGINTNIYGINAQALKDGGSTGTTAKMYGVRGEVEVDAGTCTNAYAFQSHIDHDGGTITTGYLYYGSYAGTVGTKYGVYVTGETKNYFSGNVGIGTTSPNVKLDVVGGNIALDYGKSIEVSPSSASSWTNGTTKLIETGWGTGDEVRFYTPGSQSATQKMVINSYGNVGIGTTSPGYKLDVNGTVNATSYKLTGDSTPHKQSIKNSANLSVGWYRIAENGNAVDTDANGSRCSARFTIIDYDSGRHSTRTLYAGGTYGNKPFIHLLTNTSFSGDGIISKVRVVEGSTYEGLAVEIYVDTACSTNEIRIVMDDNYQETGFTMVNFESVVADHSNMNEYELDLNTTFWGMFLDNTTKNICMLENGNVGIGTTSPSDKLHVNGGNLRISAAAGGGVYDNGYQWLECDNDTSWGRLAQTARTNGIACYNGIAINDNGGLVVGSWDSPNALGVGNGKFTGDLTVSGKIYNYNYTEVDINAPATTSGSWTARTSSSWGDPKFNNTYDRYRYNDAPGYVEYTIPSGMTTAYVSQLQWNSGGYVDVHGVQSDGGLVFLRRINTRQAVENSNEGNPDQHDGSTITFAGSGLQSFTKIRLTNKKGRFHLTGLAFTPNKNEGTEGTGMVHTAQISDLSGHPVQYVGQNVHDIVVYGNSIGRYITPLDITITPKFSNSKIMLHWVINAEAHNDQVIRIYRFISSGASSLIGFNSNNQGVHSGAAPILYDTDHNSTLNTHTVAWVDTPNTTSAVTYRIFTRPSNNGSNWFRLNRTVGGGTLGQHNHEIAVSYKSAMEIAV